MSAAKSTRVATAVGIWVLRIALGVILPTAYGLAMIGVDIVLFSVQTWANEPWEREQGPEFGSPGTWWFGILLLWAQGAAALLTMRDVWFLVKR